LGKTGTNPSFIKKNPSSGSLPDHRPGHHAVTAIMSFFKKLANEFDKLGFDSDGKDKPQQPAQRGTTPP